MTSKSLSTTVPVLSSLASVPVCAAITRSMKDGTVFLLGVAAGSATQSRTMGLCTHRTSGRVQHALGIAEHRGHIGPRGTGGAGVVGGKLHQVV